MQKDAPAWQCLLPSHKPEQQSVFEAHSLPVVLQRSFKAVHVLSAPQLPPQQASLLVHALPSETHCSAAHFPPTQLNEQQSVPAWHALPGLAQVVVLETQPVLGSHTPEQHSMPPWQVSPTAWQVPAPPLTPFAPPTPSPPLPL